jgi:hypothetical protein
MTMAATRTPGQQVQDDILKTVQTSQTAVLDAIKAWTEAVQSITPELPAPSSVRGGLADRPGSQLRAGGLRTRQALDSSPCRDLSRSPEPSTRRS